jgi:ABC-type phosphate transport system substrate-binding protein
MQRSVSVVLLGILFAGAPCHFAAAVESFAVIVAQDVSEEVVSRETLSFIFQRKQNFWRNGKRIQPVNLPALTPLRRAFSACVMGQEPESLEGYWRDLYFHGVLPPHVLQSEEAIALFVDSTPGAIGYVSRCVSGMHFKVVLTVGDVPNCPKHPVSCL